MVCPGGAGEFVDYREYAAGEDLRRLDWKVLARTGQLISGSIKRRRTSICTLVLDTSNSMSFGNPPGDRTGGPRTKLEYAQVAGVRTGPLALGGQQAEVELAIVADGLPVHPPRRDARPCRRRLLEEIETSETVPVTRLGQGLRDLTSDSTSRGPGSPE